MQKYNLPDEYKFILDRGNFELLRTILNTSFMINKHLKDEDANYLNSETHKRLVKKSEEAYFQNSVYQMGVLGNILGKDENGKYKTTINYAFTKDNYTLTISD